MKRRVALDFAKAVLNLVGDGMPYYGPSPLEAPLREILTANSLKEAFCPACDAKWDLHCDHVIYTFTGPVFMER